MVFTTCPLVLCGGSIAALTLSYPLGKNGSLLELSKHCQLYQSLSASSVNKTISNVFKWKISQIYKNFPIKVFKGSQQSALVSFPVLLLFSVLLELLVLQKSRAMQSWHTVSRSFCSAFLKSSQAGFYTRNTSSSLTLSRMIWSPASKMSESWRGSFGRVLKPKTNAAWRRNFIR